jgi:hypothetical protein
MTATQIIEHVINKFEQLVQQYPGAYFLFFSEIDQPAINAIPAGAPFIFIDKRPAILNEIQVT